MLGYAFMGKAHSRALLALQHLDVVHFRASYLQSWGWDADADVWRFDRGIAGTLEASRLARGRINSNSFEVNGTKGSIVFDVERLNELEVAGTRSFRRVLV